jgi:lipopolysaccharide biosynthesis glycosyltransferase
MNILVTTDKNYLRHAYAMLVSLLENNDTNHVELYYIHYDIDNASIDRFKKFFSQYNIAVTFLKYDFSRLEELKTGFHFTHATYLRIISPDILPEEISRILYLDPDIIVRKPLTDLYNTELGGCYLGAVSEGHLYTDKHRALDIPKGYKCFSSGVLLIDLEKFRSHNVSKQVMEYALRYADKLLLADEDALNAVLYDKFLALHPRWNAYASIICRHHDISHPLYKEIQQAISDPAIIHFTGTEKPWLPSCDHPLKELYWHYVKMTPYKYSSYLKYWGKYIVWKPKNIAAFLVRELILQLPPSVRRMIPHRLTHRLKIAASEKK